jgi:hypothetical protein
MAIRWRLSKLGLSLLAAGAATLTLVAGAAGFDGGAAFSLLAPSVDLSQSAPLFTAADGPLLPGGAPIVHSLTLSAGSGRQLGLYVQRFLARAASSAPACTAADPADRILVSIKEEGRSVFEGTLAQLASAHSSTSSLLLLPRLDAGRARVTVSARLDASATSAYMGCASVADLTWYAAQ